MPNEMDDSASTFPENEEVVPRVAELPICQKTLAGRPPLMRITLLPVAARFPITKVGLLLVTEEPAKTPKLPTVDPWFI